MVCLIIGNGVAGVTTARLLREKAPDLEIVVLSREPYPYYPRPLLIEFLAGAVQQEELFLYKAGWYKSRLIDLRLGQAVTSVNADAKLLTVAGGERIPFDSLVLATGCKAIIPPIQNGRANDGRLLPGVFSLRTLDDAIALRQAAASARQAVVVGGGYLGLEAAHSLKRMGLQRVTVLEHGPRLLSRQLDEEGATVLRRILGEMGIEVEVAVDAQSFLGEGHVSGLALVDGRSLPTDVVLLSTGVRPELSYLDSSGIATNRGVVIDDQMQTSRPGIFALGDVAEWRGQLWGIIPPALEQAPIVASNLLGGDLIYKGTVPSNTLKVVGIELAIFGDANPPGPGYEQFRRLDSERKSYLKLVLRENQLVGSVALNHRGLQNRLGQMVAQQLSMDAKGAEAFLREAEASA